MAHYTYTPPWSEPLHLDEVKAYLRVTSDDEDDLLTAMIPVARQYCETVSGRQFVAATLKLTLDGFAPEIRLRPPLYSVGSITYVDTGGTTQTVDTAVYTVDTRSFVPRVYETYGQFWPSARGTADCVTVTYNAGYIAKFTANATTNVCTLYGRTVANADIVRLTNSSGDLPAPLAVDTDYHVRDVTGSTFKLAASAGGTAIDLTDVGTGTSFVGVLPPNYGVAIKLLVGHLYENREATMERALEEVPLSLHTLLGQDRVYRF